MFFNHKIGYVGLIFIAFLIIGMNGSGLEKDANASQFFYMIKQLFPDINDVSVFLSEESLANQKTIMDRAAAQYKLKVKIFIIDTSIDVGKRIRELGENSVLVIFNSDVLMKKSTKLYILKNCKGKKIAIFTSSRDYSDLGALMGIIKNGNNSVDLVLNLKHNEHFKPKFTDAFIEKVGISEVIQ